MAKEDIKIIFVSSYYVSCDGRLCITFKNGIDCPELCEVVGLLNETWFKHKIIN